MFYLIGWLSDNGFNWLLMVQTHTIIFFKQGFMPQFNGFERINGIFRVDSWDFHCYVLQQCILPKIKASEAKDLSEYKLKKFKPTLPN